MVKRNPKNPDNEATLAEKSPKRPKSLSEFRNLNIKLTLDSMSSLNVPDQLVIQTILMIEDTEKAANRLSSRLRDWLSWPVPEAKYEISDNEKLTNLVSNLNKDALVADITSRAKKGSLPDHFGINISDDDWQAIQISAQNINMLFQFKTNLESILEVSMQKLAPNMKSVCGSLIAAKLIAIAGSLKRITEMTSGTVQLLGAEKALFRHIKTGARCPKHGIIINHPLVSNASKKDKGRVARVLANKISMAARVDYFKGNFIGDHLNAQLARLKK